MEQKCDLPKFFIFMVLGISSFQCCTYTGIVYVEKPVIVHPPPDVIVVVEEYDGRCWSRPKGLKYHQKSERSSIKRNRGVTAESVHSRKGKHGGGRHKLSSKKKSRSQGKKEQKSNRIQRK